MPLYEYMCRKCGPFTEIGSISNWSAPLNCPECDSRSERTISAPGISNMDPYRRIAHQRNERSADEPKMVSKAPHDHAACGHGHAHRHPSSSHSHGPSRPWMIGH